MPVLHSAVKRLDEREVQRLLNEPGCDVNQKDEEGYTPLHYLVLAEDRDKRHHSIISRGMSSEKIEIIVNGINTDPESLYRKRYRLAQLLLSKGAEVDSTVDSDSQGHQGKTALQLYIEPTLPPISSDDADQSNAVISAPQLRHYDYQIISLFASHGAVVTQDNLKDWFNRTHEVINCFGGYRPVRLRYAPDGFVDQGETSYHVI